MNTIDDIQNEMDCLYHYNEFEYNHDFVIFLYHYFIHLYPLLLISFIISIINFRNAL